jgi:hypothetical protein
MLLLDNIYNAYDDRADKLVKNFDQNEGELENIEIEREQKMDEAKENYEAVF